MKSPILAKFFGALVFTGALLACTHTGLEQPLKLEFSRYEQIEQWTEALNIELLHQKIAKQELTAVELTQFYLKQVEQKDGKLNSIIAINPQALEIAQKLDQEAEAGQLRSVLHGIPILLKDNIETKDMATTAGSLALKDNRTGRDATFVANLRKAGAIILGKTNLSEWANIRSERSSSGWSAVGGQTRNPHDTSRSACGSSSGSGAAIAANLAVAAVGTETDGSITCPAAMTGVVGFKPSVGLVSRFGIVPISETQDTAGPMTRHVTDAAILLEFMQSEDSKDPATTVFRHNLVPQKLEVSSLKELTLGLMYSSATEHEAVAAIEDNFIEQLQQQGTDVTDKLRTEPYDGFWGDSYEVLLFELKHTLNRYLGGLPNQLNHLTLAKLIEFNRQHKEQEMKYFQQEIFEKAEAKGGLENQKYQQALQKVREETQSTLQQMVNENRLDAIIAITRGPAWKIDKINGDLFNGGVSTYAAVAGYPHATVPLDDVFGLPIGLSVIGLKGQDQKVLKVAAMLEDFIRTKYQK